MNATVGETDPRQCVVLAGRIAALHAAHGYEPVVPERLAEALMSATAVESDPRQCVVLAERIAALNTAHGHEPAVRELLAEALLNVTVIERDRGARRGPSACVIL